MSRSRANRVATISQTSLLLLLVSQVSTTAFEGSDELELPMSQSDLIPAIQSDNQSAPLDYSAFPAVEEPDVDLASRSIARRQALFGGGSLMDSLTDYDSYPMNGNVELSKSLLMAGSTTGNAQDESPQSSSQFQAQNQFQGSSGQKMGPQFSREPPSFVYYLNSTDLVIPCSASGNPEPAIVSIPPAVLLYVMRHYGVA